MEAEQIDQKIDEAAGAAKRAVGAVDDTRQVASELARALIANAREVFERATANGESRLTAQLTRAARHLEQTVTRLADSMERWATKAAERREAAAAARLSRRASRWLDEE